MKKIKTYIYNNWNFILLFVPLFFCFVSPVYAVDVSFQWDPNSEPDLAGYRVFSREEGKSYNYSTPAWEGITAYCTIYNLDETKNYYFISRAFDTQGLDSVNSNELYLESTPGTTNQPPIANAGPDQTVDKGQLVNLNGSNSTDPDDGIASYHWVQTDGLMVNLSDPNGQQLTFATPNVGTEGAPLIFELTVIDHSGLQNTDTCVVNVTWVNEKPEANAGTDQVVDEGAVVILDGSSSFDIDDGIVSYLWTQIEDPTVTLTNPASSRPTFTAPSVGPDGASLPFNLTVTDAGGLQDNDSCIVNISWQNESPTAVVIPDYMEVIEGALVRLDGTASTDSDDGIASYLWSQVEGHPVSLSDPTSAVTTFTAPNAKPHGKNIKFKLTVKDHGGLKGTADSFIYVMQNELPTLNSVTITGSTQVNESSGAQYALMVNYSDGSSTNVTSSASWSEISSYASISSSGYLTTGSVASDQSCTITASYGGQSDTHNVSIKNVPPNNSPAVDFSYATRRKKVTFTDRSTDSDGTIVSWFWDFGDGNTSTEQNPRHRYVKFRNYPVTLTVTDDGGVSDSTSKTVSITK